MLKVESHPEEKEHPMKRNHDTLAYILMNGYHTQSLLQVVGPTMTAVFSVSILMNVRPLAVNYGDLRVLLGLI